MKVKINTKKQQIIFKKGDWIDLMPLLELYPEFTVYDERFLQEEVVIEESVYPWTLGTTYTGDVVFTDRDITTSCCKQ